MGGRVGLGCEGGAPMMGLVLFYEKEAMPQLSLHHVRIQHESPSVTQRGFSLESNHLRSSGPRSMRKKCLWCVVIVAQAD